MTAIADPLTGQALPDASPDHHPKVLRALYSALLQLQGMTPDAGLGKQLPNGASRQLPINAGKPWRPAEDARLGEDFDTGISIAELAGRHQRTRGAIGSRLARLGKLAPSEDDRD